MKTTFKQGSNQERGIEKCKYAKLWNDMTLTARKKKIKNCPLRVVSPPIWEDTEAVNVAKAFPRQGHDPAVQQHLWAEIHPIG